MKNKNLLPEIDVIGGLGVLTSEEEKELSIYFKKLKEGKLSKNTIKNTKSQTS